MGKNKNQIHTNEVEQYLVKRIKELEKEVGTLKKDNDLLKFQKLALKADAEKYQELKKLFEFSGDGITKAIYMRDFDGIYTGMFAIDSDDNFNKYLELLELGTFKKGE